MTTNALSDRVAYAIATGLGAGFVPIAPGTIGAIEGVAIYCAINALAVALAVRLSALIVINIILFAAGVWASNRTCTISGIKDPSVVVVDEVSGQLIALTPIALFPVLSIPALVLGFVMFRLFDIFKPYPIRRLERLPGGFGVMADDVLAGIYAAVFVWLYGQFRTF